MPNKVIKLVTTHDLGPILLQLSPPALNQPGSDLHLHRIPILRPRDASKRIWLRLLPQRRASKRLRTGELLLYLFLH